MRISIEGCTLVLDLAIENPCILVIEQVVPLPHYIVTWKSLNYHPNLLKLNKQIIAKNENTDTTALIIFH